MDQEAAVATQTINILRVAAGQQKAALARLAELQTDLTGALENAEGLSPNKLAKLDALLKQTDKSIAQGYSDIKATHAEGLAGVAKIESKHAAKLVTAGIGVPVVSVMIPEKQLETIVDGKHIFGHSAGEWWDGQATDLQQKFRGVVQQGILLGQSVDEMTSKVRGTKAGNFEDGIMAAKKREAAALVRSAAISVANEARIRQFKEMSDIVKGIQWISTLDTRTTPICRALDGKQWRLPDFKPIGHDKQFPGPTAHWNCRSSQISVLRSWEELSGKELPSIGEEELEAQMRKNAEAAGLPPEKVALQIANQRASMNGPVKGTTTFEDWLRLQSDAQIDKVLGPGKAALWKTGKLTVSDMTDQTNRPLTIAQLEDFMENGKPLPETLGANFLPMVSDSVKLTAKTTDELNAKATKEIDATLAAADDEPPAKAPPDTSAATIAEILASQEGKNLKAKWITKIQAENPDMAAKDVLANATQQALMEQTAKNKASTLSKAKKKLTTGKPLSPSEKAAIDGLTAEEAEAFTESVNDKLALTKAQDDAVAQAAAAKVAAAKAKAIQDLIQKTADGTGMDRKEWDEVNAVLTPAEIDAAEAQGVKLYDLNEKKAQVSQKVYDAAANGKTLADIPKADIDLLSSDELNKWHVAGTKAWDNQQALATAKATASDKVKMHVASGGSLNDMAAADIDALTIGEKLEAVKAGNDLKLMMLAQAKALADAKAAVMKKVTDAVASGNDGDIDKIPTAELDLLEGTDYADAILAGQNAFKAQSAAFNAKAKEAMKAAAKRKLMLAQANDTDDAFNALSPDDFALLSDQDIQEAMDAGQVMKLKKQGPEKLKNDLKAAILSGDFPGQTIAVNQLNQIGVTWNEIDDLTDLYKKQKANFSDTQMAVAVHIANGGTLSDLPQSLKVNAGKMPFTMLQEAQESGQKLAMQNAALQAPAQNLVEKKALAGALLITKTAKGLPLSDTELQDVMTLLSNDEYMAAVDAGMKAKAANPPAQSPYAEALAKVQKAAASGKPTPKSVLKALKGVPDEDLQAAIAAGAQQAADKAAKAAAKLAKQQAKGGGAAPMPVQTPGAPAAHPQVAIVPPTPLERIPVNFPKEAGKLKVVKKLGGSTGAELVEWEGRQFVRKKGASKDHVRSEFIADRVYEALGVDVPQGALYEEGGQVIKLTEFRQGKEFGKLTGAEKAAAVAKFKEGFVADVLMGNWDVLGAGQDNALWDGKNVIRIDNGGSLDFRAMGTPKLPHEWTGIPREIFTMRDRGDSPVVGGVMQGTTLHDLAPSLRALRPEALDGIDMPDQTRAVLKERLRHLKDLGGRAGDLGENNFRPEYTEEHAKTMFDFRERRIDLSLMGKTNRSGTTLTDENGRSFGNLRKSGGAGMAKHQAAVLLPGDTFSDPVIKALKNYNAKVTKGGVDFNPVTIAAAIDQKAKLSAMFKTETGEKKEMAKHYLGAILDLEHAMDAAKAGKLAPLPVFESYKPKAAPKANPVPVATVSVVDDLQKMLRDQGVPQAAIDLHGAWNVGQGHNSWNSETLIAKYWMSQVARKVPKDEHYWDGNGTKRTFAQAKKAWDDAVAKHGKENVEKVFSAHHGMMMEQLERMEVDYVDRDTRTVLLMRTESPATLKANGINPASVKKGDVVGLQLGATESHSIFNPVYVKGSIATVKAVPFSRVLYSYWFEARAGSGGAGFLGDGENEFAADTSGIPSLIADTGARTYSHPIQPSRTKADWIKAGVPDVTAEHRTGKLK